MLTGAVVPTTASNFRLILEYRLLRVGRIRLKFKLSELGHPSYHGNTTSYHGNTTSYHGNALLIYSLCSLSYSPLVGFVKYKSLRYLTGSTRASSQLGFVTELEMGYYHTQ